MEKLEKLNIQLNKLSLEELLQIKKSVAYLLSTKKSSHKEYVHLESDKMTNASLIYFAFYRKLKPSLPKNVSDFLKYKTEKDIELFKVMCDDIDSYFEKLIGKGDRVLRIKFYYFVADTLLAHLKNTEFSFSFTVIVRMQMWEEFIGLVEQSFPGYVYNGFFSKILENYK